MKDNFLVIDWRSGDVIYSGPVYLHFDREYIDYLHKSPYRPKVQVCEYYFERHNS
jgi:hypothetical protein